MQMKIGFTGTQSAITVAQFDLLTAVIDELEEMTEAHHGDCIGADKVFSELVDAIKFAVVMHTHPPLVEDKRAFCRADVEHEAKAFLVRNHDIVDACGEDVILCCPKGDEIVRSGTWATIRYAKKKSIEVGLKVHILYPDGQLEEVDYGGSKCPNCGARDYIQDIDS